MDFRSEILARISVMEGDSILPGLVSRVGDHVIQLDCKERGSAEAVLLRFSPEGVTEAADAGEPSLRVSGPAWAWSALLARQMPYIAAINGYHGGLTVSGNAVVGAWLTPALSRVFA
ncbi:hypothetical protein I6E52_08005 [Salinibacterium sp. NG253]|uniref:SCP2 sterol-binding domain-containing protein n=1 Tax=Salinibacterium sp. NG253 TaxID=2792039 RepID=UPI0018CD04D1|nr:SCP2 sterol-binding domain-containing protein [Salinibacterium sp. NG253]MBH0116790.1 hypothetical protein [Salinibacterium sp. NG253]